MPRFPPLGPGSNPTGALCALGIQSLDVYLDRMGFSVNSLGVFPPTSKTVISSSSSLLVLL